MSVSLVDEALRRRELVRRRRLLATLGGLLLLVMLPVLGHHVVSAVDWLPASVQHAGPFCMVALHRLLAPLHTGFHWLLLAGVVFAVAERARAHARLRSALGRVTLVPLPNDGRMRDAVRLADVAPRHVRVGRSLAIPAFTAGLVAPRIYLSVELGDTLSTEELAAVIAHEEIHRRRRDPLRLTALRFFSGLLFWMPAFRRAADDFADEAEIDADTAAAERFPAALASAIVAMAHAGQDRRRVASVVPFFSADLLERRLQRLAGIEPTLGSRVSGRSLVVASLALFAAWGSGVMVLHPLPLADVVHATHPPHCLQHHTAPYAHLFCRGTHWSLGDSPCPHSE